MNVLAHSIFQLHFLKSNGLLYFSRLTITELNELSALDVQVSLFVRLSVMYFEILNSKAAEKGESPLFELPFGNRREEMS